MLGRALSLTLISLLVFAFASAQQTTKYIIPQYNFSQIDSLVDSNIKAIRRKETPDVVIAWVDWDCGSFVHPKDSFASYSNKFRICFLAVKNKRASIFAIDNFGQYNAAS